MPGGRRTGSTFLRGQLSLVLWFPNSCLGTRTPGAGTAFPNRSLGTRASLLTALLFDPLQLDITQVLVFARLDGQECQCRPDRNVRQSGRHGRRGGSSGDTKSIQCGGESQPAARQPSLELLASQ